MSESSIHKWFPFDISWYLTASQSWDPAWGGPVLWVLCKMWPDGARTLNDDRALAQTARVSLATWKKIRVGLGDFFRVDGDFLVQDVLAAKHAENVVKYTKRVDKGKNAIAARWEKQRAKDSLSNTPSITSGDTPSIPQVPIRGINLSFLGSDLEREEGSNATAVPTFPEDHPEILGALAAFPKTRLVPGGGSTQVRIGENAARLAAAYLTKNPTYPLTLAAKYTARTDKHTPDFQNWITNPPAASVVMAAYEAFLRQREADRIAREGLSTDETRKVAHA